MPTMEFVQSCIKQPKNIKKGNFIFFNFYLKTETKISRFRIYKDLKGLDTTLKFVLSLHELNEVTQINRFSNDSFYNYILSLFEIPENSIFRCFLAKEFNQKYLNYDYKYYICYDDIPLKFKGINTVSTSSSDYFLKRFSKDDLYAIHKNYITTNYDFYSLHTYTTIYGSSWTCTSLNALSADYSFDNCSCLFLPIGVRNKITNYADENDEYSYSTNFNSTPNTSFLVYWVSLAPFELVSDSCCLAECFGITNQ